MKYSKKSLNQFKKYDQYIKSKRKHLYDSQPDRKPQNYSSIKEACKAIENERIKFVQVIMNDKKLRNEPDLNAGQVADAIINAKIAIVIIPGIGGINTLAYYNYDKKMYEIRSNSKQTAFDDYVKAAFRSKPSNSFRDLVEDNLDSYDLHDKMAIYNPPEEYEIPVGNGIFNCLTGQLDEYDPYITITSKIATNYVKNATHPHFESGFKFEKVISDFCNNNEDRIILFNQIIKTIILGKKPSSAIFLVLGEGGSGKSLVFRMCANVVGKEHTGEIKLDELNKDDKIVEVYNKKLAIGYDNNANIYLGKTSIFKLIASNEYLSMSRKYLSSISASFDATMVQLCNSMPRFGETGSEIARRAVILKAENDLSGKANKSFEKDIKNEQLHEYILSYMLDETKVPYFSNYNAIDNQILNDTLSEEDYLSQFIDDMASFGFISESNTKIPTNVLYAAYQDWHNANMQSSKMISKSGFSVRIKSVMNKIGYQFNTDLNLNHTRLSTLNSEGSIDIDDILNSDYCDDKLSEALNKRSTRSNYFMLTDKLNTSKRILKRNSVSVSVIQYFNLADEFRNLFGKNFNRKDLIEENKSEFDVEIVNNKLLDNQNNLQLTSSNVKSANDEQLHELLATATAVASKEQSNIAVRHFLDDINMRSVSNDELREELLDFISELNNK